MLSPRKGTEIKFYLPKCVVDGSVTIAATPPIRTLHPHSEAGSVLKALTGTHSTVHPSFEIGVRHQLSAAADCLEVGWKVLYLPGCP